MPLITLIAIAWRLGPSVGRGGVRGLTQGWCGDLQWVWPQPDALGLAVDESMGASASLCPWSRAVPLLQVGQRRLGELFPTTHQLVCLALCLYYLLFFCSKNGVAVPGFVLPRRKRKRAIGTWACSSLRSGLSGPFRWIPWK